jgi:hypothetical protein
MPSPSGFDDSPCRACLLVAYAETFGIAPMAAKIKYPINNVTTATENKYLILMILELRFHGLH